MPIMKIYTKGGDRGETSLLHGVRVPKNHLRIIAYGTLDELNALMGVVIAELVSEKFEESTESKKKANLIQTRLRRIQGELFQLGAELATPQGKSLRSQLIGASQIEVLENEIDQMETELEPLRSFILPGGAKVSALAHLARTVSRRAERELITLHHIEPARLEVLQYMNRLSDYLFVSARYMNLVYQVEDIPWMMGAT